MNCPKEILNSMVHNYCRYGPNNVNQTNCREAEVELLTMLSIQPTIQSNTRHRDAITCNKVLRERVESFHNYHSKKAKKKRNRRNKKINTTDIFNIHLDDTANYCLFSDSSIGDLDMDIARFVSVSTTNEINYLDDEFHNKTYEKCIRLRANNSCKSCEKFLFANQIHFLNKDVKIKDEIFDRKASLCSFCFKKIKGNEIPSISVQHNNITTEPIPEVLKCLNSIERKMISFIQVFMTIIILPGGQFAEKGLVLNLPTDVQNIANQLPCKSDNLDLIAVQFLHQDKYEPVENFNYRVSPSRLNNALIWLKENNVLYRNITVQCNIDNSPLIEKEDYFDFDAMEHSTLTPMNSSIPLSNISSFMHNKDSVINVPSITENPVHILDIDNGEEMAYPWLFPTGKCGLNFPRSIKIPRSMYFKQRLYHKSGQFRRDMTYLLHSAVSVDMMLLKSEISIKMRIRSGRTSSGSVTAGEIRDIENNPSLIENSYMFMKNIRGTVAYFKNQLYNLLAMFKALGPPTLFMTLSADDMHWKELGCLLNNLDYNDVSNESNFHGVKRDPLMTAVHFERRFDALMRHIVLNGIQPLGKVRDYFARVEFQNRGSPHIHMFFWIENIPSVIDHDSVIQLKQYIDKTILSVIPDRNVDHELSNLVVKLQSHSHTQYCSNNHKSKCRFGFPKQECCETKIFTHIDFSKKTKGKFYVTRRDKNDIMINSYNPVILRHWRANMDIQLICNAEGAAYYVCSYICKSEPDELKNALGHLIHNVFETNPTIPRHVKLLKIGLTVLRNRRMSSQEAAYSLSNLKLIHTSRRFVYLNTRRPSQRFKILKSRKELDDLSDNSTDVFERNIHDYYQQRPRNMDNVSLYRFASWYEKTSLGQPKRKCLERIYIDKYNLWMKKVKNPFVIRSPTFPSYSDDYYYSLMVLLLPHRSDDEIIFPFPSAKDAFINKKSKFDTSVDFTHFSFTQQIENTMRRII